MVKRYLIDYILMGGLIWVFYHFSSTATWLCLLDVPIAPIALHVGMLGNRHMLAYICI